jgi:hypothetical protein
MTALDVARDRLATVVIHALTLLGAARLSWMRIVLALVYGANTYHLVRSWRRFPDSPDLGFDDGWVLALTPDWATDLLLRHPERVAVAVLALTFLSVLGLGTRFALIALAAIGLFARAVQTSDGIFDHEGSLATQVLIVLAFAPGTNTVSLEHLIRWWRAGRTNYLESLKTPVRQWGTYLIIALLAITYTASGASKLRFGGLAWLDGQTLGFYLRGLTAGGDVYMVGGGPPTWRDDLGLEMYTYGNYQYGNFTSALAAALADWVAHNAVALVVLSIATVALELAGLLLFIPRLRSVLLVGYIGMHTSIGLLMGLPFIPYQIICFFLIEWELLAAYISRRRDARRAAIASEHNVRPHDEEAREHG